ncbi:MAG: hypothetical protein JSW50_00325, partial [Candidatus Latescibacterota bacterium]
MNKPDVSTGSTNTSARSCAVFVVHGMGDQEWADTASSLDAGFKKAFDAISKWQQKHLSPPDQAKYGKEHLRSPHIHEGYWADYPEFAQSFSKDGDDIHDH